MGLKISSPSSTTAGAGADDGVPSGVKLSGNPKEFEASTSGTTGVDILIAGWFETNGLEKLSSSPGKPRFAGDMAGAGGATFGFPARERKSRSSTRELGAFDIVYEKLYEINIQIRIEYF